IGRRRDWSGDWDFKGEGNGWPERVPGVEVRATSRIDFDDHGSAGIGETGRSLNNQVQPTSIFILLSRRRWRIKLPRITGSGSIVVVGRRALPGELPQCHLLR